MDELSQAVQRQGAGGGQEAATAYMGACTAYKEELLDIQAQLSRSAEERAREAASTDLVASSHVAVTAQKDLIKFGYETKLRNLRARLAASAASHQTELVDLQQRLTVAVPPAQSSEIRAVLERASQLELSAAQDAPVDELQASVLATLKSQLAEHAAAGSSLRLQADSLGNQPSSSSKTQRIFDVLSKILGLKQTPANKHKSRAVFDILVNTLALSQAIIAVGSQTLKVGSQTLTRMGTKTLSRLMPPHNKPETRSEELFRVLFNCMLLSQAAVHQSLDRHGALRQVKPVRSREGKGGVFVKA